MTVDNQVVLDTRVQGGKEPDVSIVVPVFNVASFVGACLESIRLNARDIRLELIVIDDGSQDSSHEVICELLDQWKESPVVYVRQENQGLSAARNRGAALASGQFIGFMDSDDLMALDQLHQMVDMARRTRADLILGRTEVFDSVTEGSRDFYDSSCWDALLGSQSFLVTNAKDSPGILSLEPNVNYRLISRQFYRKAALGFPEGLFFEDAAVHLRMLLQAQTVVMSGDIYYRYRVNRPGKITEERSRRRFDVLPVCSQALGELREANASPAQAGAALRGLFRLVWGCGGMTLADQRYAFFVEAAQVFAALPGEWMIAYLKRHRGDPKHAVLGLLMAMGAFRVLTAVSFARANRFIRARSPTY